MEDFITDEQMIRTKNVIRKLMYRKTMDIPDDEILQEYGFLYDYHIEFEGWDKVVITIKDYLLRMEEIIKMNDIDEIDDIALMDEEIRIYIERRE